MFYAFFWVIPRHLNFIWRHFVTLCPIFVGLPMKMEQTECSETSAYKIQTPRNYPEESIRQFLASPCCEYWGFDTVYFGILS